jgi:hypothetical protein
MLVLRWIARSAFAQSLAPAVAFGKAAVIDHHEVRHPAILLEIAALYALQVSMCRANRSKAPAPRMAPWLAPTPSMLTHMESASIPGKGRMALVVTVTE